MIKMVNLICRKCGMSLDVDAEHIQEFCPHCGEELLIRITTAMDIWNEKKVLKRKDLKYATQVSDVNIVKSKDKRKVVINKTLLFVTIFMVVLFAALGYFKVVL